MTRLTAIVVAVAATTAGVAAIALGSPGQRDREVTVMTRNLFLGTDLKPILEAPSVLALLGATGVGWQQVQTNDIVSRAETLADEIVSAEPDLVGLQEAMLFRTDAPADGPATPAETPALDFVQLLVDALAARGVEYEPAATFAGTDVELPVGLPPALDVRLTDRVVVLARTGGADHLKLSDPRSGRYAAELRVNTAAGPIVLPRGWASVDAKLRGRSFRFVATHLEAFAAPLRNAQAAELVAGPAAAPELPVVLVGDMNSGPGTDETAYGMLASAGFVDAWDGGGGQTCCHAVDLRLPDPTLTKRIDLVLTSGGFETVGAAVVGEEPRDRTPGGLWPSDHAGLVVTLRLPGT